LAGYRMNFTSYLHLYSIWILSKCSVSWQNFAWFSSVSLD
jgi:hypothetical protein